MKKKDVEDFIGKECRLTKKKDKFTIYGKIVSVSDDCLVFKTDKTTNIINFDAVEEITFKD